MTATMRPLPATAERSHLMRSVRQSGTAPELAVRRYLHAQGLRFRLHPAALPGRPDVVLPRYAAAVFVHGCFWHGHHCRHGAVAARRNAGFWQAKIAANRARDARKARALRALGWHVLTIWECQVGDVHRLGRLRARIVGVGLPDGAAAAAVSPPAPPPRPAAPKPRPVARAR